VKGRYQFRVRWSGNRTLGDAGTTESVKTKGLGITPNPLCLMSPLSEEGPPSFMDYFSVPESVVMRFFPESTVIVNVSPDTRAEGRVVQLPAE